MSKIGNALRNLLYAATFATASVLPGCEPDEPPIVKSIEQYVDLDNSGVKIEYSAKLSNVDKAKLEVKREGVLISTEEINDVSQYGEDYKKTYSYDINPLIKKGNYEFTLTSEDKSYNSQKKDNITIPDYPATVNYTSIDLSENSEITVPLELSDINPEDNPVNAVSATSSQVQTTLEGNNNLKIKAPSNYYGPYQLKLKYGSTEGGLEEKTLQGNIMKDIKMNPFIQPNDSTLNWYGSGDVNKDNIVNSQDVARIIELINGTYSDPYDKRLYDRADVNGDESVNISDKTLIENKLNGAIPYLPGYWNELQTRVEREDWLRKMLAIDKTNEIPQGNGFGCLQSAEQLMINFNGFDEKAIAKLLKIYPYDISNNCRFNVPVKEVAMSGYDLNGIWISGHERNTVILDNNASNWGDKSDIEPQNDQINVQTEQDSLYGINSVYYILDPKRDGNDAIYMRYDIKNNIPTLIYTNPNLITQRGK